MKFETDTECLLQEDHQLTVLGPTGRNQRSVRFHRGPRGCFPAVVATGHEHEEDFHNGGGCDQEEVVVHPDKASSGERGGWN